MLILTNIVLSKILSTHTDCSAVKSLQNTKSEEPVRFHWLDFGFTQGGVWRWQALGQGHQDQHQQQDGGDSHLHGVLVVLVDYSENEKQMTDEIEYYGSVFILNSQFYKW